MNTDVVIKSSMELKVGGAFRLAIHKNNTVTFRAVGGAAQLVFPAHTAAILSPKPEHTVVLADSGHLTFTFNSAAPGNYCVLTLPMHVKVPDSIPCAALPV